MAQSFLSQLRSESMVAWRSDNLVPTKEVIVWLDQSPWCTDAILKKTFILQNQCYEDQTFAFMFDYDCELFRLTPSFGILKPQVASTITLVVAEHTAKHLRKEHVRIAFQLVSPSVLKISDVDWESFWSEEKYSPKMDYSRLDFKFVPREKRAIQTVPTYARRTGVSVIQRLSKSENFVTNVSMKSVKKTKSLRAKVVKSSISKLHVPSQSLSVKSKKNSSSRTKLPKNQVSKSSTSKSNAKKSSSKGDSKSHVLKSCTPKSGAKKCDSKSSTSKGDTKSSTSKGDTKSHVLKSSKSGVKKRNSKSFTSKDDTKKSHVMKSSKIKRGSKRSTAKGDSKTVSKDSKTSDKKQLLKIATPEKSKIKVSESPASRCSTPKRDAESNEDESIVKQTAVEEFLSRNIGASVHTWLKNSTTKITESKEKSLADSSASSVCSRSSSTSRTKKLSKSKVSKEKKNRQVLRKSGTKKSVKKDISKTSLARRQRRVMIISNLLLATSSDSNESIFKSSKQKGSETFALERSCIRNASSESSVSSNMSDVKPPILSKSVSIPLDSKV